MPPSPHWTAPPCPSRCRQASRSSPRTTSTAPGRPPSTSRSAEPGGAGPRRPHPSRGNEYGEEGRWRSRVAAAVAGTVSDPEVWIEDERLSLVVHTRLTSHPGKEVVELRLRDIDKGSALERLVDTRSRAVVFAGDDVGDLPAFAGVR